MQSSVAVTAAVKSGTATWQFAPALPVWSSPQLVRVGAVVSLTVIVTVEHESLVQPLAVLRARP